MSKREKLRRALHIKNFILICGLGFLLLVFLSGILPILATTQGDDYPRSLTLTFACLGDSRVKAFVSWPQYDGGKGPYEVQYREKRNSLWRHLLVTNSTLTTLEELFSQRKYDFRVFSLGDGGKLWAVANGAKTPTCNAS